VAETDVDVRSYVEAVAAADAVPILAIHLACTSLLPPSLHQIWKIENPLGGDDTRFWGPPFVKAKSTPVITSSKSTANAYVSIGESAYFLAANRNKHSLAINVKDPTGSALVRSLAQHADVVVENWMPGKLDEFGLDYESLRRVNPGIIYASLTGFGPTGPLSTQPGYDVMASARGGLMHITGGVDEPSKVGVAITDLSTGLVLHGAILAALFARERDPQKRGQRIDTNLLEVQVASLANIGQNYHCDPRMVGRRIAHSSHESIVPYQAFQCKSSSQLPSPSSASPSSTPSTLSSSSSVASPSTEYFICGALNNKQFANLIAAVQQLSSELGPGVLDVSWITQPRFQSNADRVRHRDELIPLLQDVFARFDQRHLLAVMAKHDIPSAPINNLAQVFADEQVVASGIVKTLQHPLVGEMRVTGSPVHFSETPTQISMPPPLLGQHTQEVLQRVLGTSTERLKELEQEDVIGSYGAIE
jgi:succinate--hydroxymethylglutarate CoA-transferase